MTRILLIGGGAISEMYYAPALRSLQRTGLCQLAGLVEPDAGRRAKLLGGFERATGCATLGEALSSGNFDLGIVASPARFHAEQTVELLKKGVAVLCEKPMAATVSEAERMLQAQREAQRPLAIGLFRRFFPALQEIKHLIAADTFGKVLRVDVQEGGQFNWPAASASFFQKRSAHGGVFHDVGVHVLDILIWWLGEAVSFDYADDAMGSLEINARASLEFPAEVRGTVFLSRDWTTRNEWVIEFEKAMVTWKAGEANRLHIRSKGSDRILAGNFEQLDGTDSDSYRQSFSRQLLNAVECAATGREPFISGEEGIKSLRLIEACYGARTLIDQPWMPEVLTQRRQDAEAIHR